MTRHIVARIMCPLCRWVVAELLWALTLISAARFADSLLMLCYKGQTMAARHCAHVHQPMLPTCNLHRTLATLNICTCLKSHKHFRPPKESKHSRSAGSAVAKQDLSARKLHSRAAYLHVFKRILGLCNQFDCSSDVKVPHADAALKTNPQLTHGLLGKTPKHHPWGFQMGLSKRWTAFAPPFQGDTIRFNRAAPFEPSPQMEHFQLWLENQNNPKPYILLAEVEESASP